MVVYYHGFSTSRWMVDIEIWRDTKIVKRLNLFVVFPAVKNTGASRLINDKKEPAGFE